MLYFSEKPEPSEGPRGESNQKGGVTVNDLLLPRIVPLPKTKPVSLLLTHDGLAAYLYYPVSAPLRAYNAVTLAQRMHEAGIPGTLDFAKIQQFTETPARGKRPRPALVATGRRPEPGAQGAWMHPAPGGDAAGEAPAFPTFFAQGATVWEHAAGGSGAPGADVYGRPLAPPGPAVPATGAGLSRRGEAIVADYSGFLFKINDTYGLSPTCYLTGGLLAFFSPLIVPESVHVAGSVPARAHIEAGKDIAVKGAVGRGARLTAGGSISVGGEACHCVLRAQGALRCSVVHHSTLEARGDVEIMRRLDEKSFVTASGFLRAADGSTVANAAVEALKGADLWSVRSERGGTCVIAVGLTRAVEREVAALEAKIRKLGEQRERVFDRFNARFERLLANREEIWRLAPEDREQFEMARADATAQQEQFDAQISALRSKQHQLTARRERCPEATIRVRSAATAGVEFMLRKRRYTGVPPLEGPFVVFESADHQVLVEAEADRVKERSYG
jgi:hypothetical protein